LFYFGSGALQATLSVPLSAVICSWGCAGSPPGWASYITIVSREEMNYEGQHFLILFILFTF